MIDWPSVVQGLVPLGFGVRLCAVALAVAFVRSPRWCRRWALGGSIVASCLTGASAAVVVFSGATVRDVVFHHSATGLSFGFAITPLSGWFLLVLGILAVPAAFYSVGYLAHAVPPQKTAFVVAGFNVLLAAVEAVFVADSIVVFLFAWEAMTLATTALVATEHEITSNRRAAWVFLVMSHVGTGCLMAGFFVLASYSGSSNFAVALGGGAVQGGLRDLVFVLFLAGFGVKAGVIPLHVWLPEAHPAAPTSVSALMSGVLVTTGLYGIVRVCVFGLGAPEWSWGVAVALLGALSALLGVLYALTQTDIKRLLAYSTIENVGIVLLGVGTAMMALATRDGGLASLALVAALFHILNHAAFKGLLFLGAGGVVMATGTRHIEKMGGLAKRMPWTTSFFLVGAAAISGLPFFNGFVSEWVLFQALLQGFRSTPSLSRLVYPVAGSLLALTTALAAACFVKAFGISFLARPRGEGAEQAHESPWTMLVPQACLAGLCVVLGLVPGATIAALERVAGVLPGVKPHGDVSRGLLSLGSGAGSLDFATPVLLALAVLSIGGVTAVLFLGLRRGRRREPTWGCGGELSAETEYTATAFSKPLMRVFAAIYRPMREVSRVESLSPYFPSEVKYRASIEPTFERFLYRPMTRLVLGAAQRMKIIQAGSLHAYLAYVLFLGIGLLLWLGGGR